ncbi:MAG TPA: adenylosuccinate lyase [Phycisphaerales bacterium]|nr:adenylosuccinate lyase [Phycisphaerales bacterium]
MATFDRYESPLSSRNASSAMQAIWSPQRKFTTWRRLWLALAEAEKELGLPIRDEQVAELRRHLDDIDYLKAAEYEKKLRHDVMAHIHALGDVAPAARPIIHLGATSQFVVCNTELLLIRDALNLIAKKLANVIDQLATFATKWKFLPTLAFTHYQPAQPTTVGKRAALWAHDLALALEEIEHRISSLRFRGVKGTTGTQASFLELFQGIGLDDAEAHRRCEELDKLVAQKMHWSPQRRFVITGQTYPRVIDGPILASLAMAAAAAMKFATDVRLLANRKEIEEPFEASQVGSSAMPYKRNPMRCERATALARFVASLAANAYATASAQWLERTLDDSANRRLSLPEAFLAIDGALDLLHNVCDGLIVHEGSVRRNLEQEMPFLATEALMLNAARAGRDRQQVHEAIRRHAIEASRLAKQEGKAPDLLQRLRGEPLLAGVDFGSALDPGAHIGRASEQAARVIGAVIEPARARYGGRFAALASSAPSV